ncbi:hypothetical protein M1432_00310 [Patescibacteria group bacterium]|nr:hypothetical protein [Patescibacteria group bacterium]
MEKFVGGGGEWEEVYEPPQNEKKPETAPESKPAEPAASNEAPQTGPDKEGSENGPSAEPDFEKRAESIIKNAESGKYDQISFVPEGMKDVLRKYDVSEEDIANRSFDELTGILKGRMAEKTSTKTAEKTPVDSTEKESEGRLKTAREIALEKAGIKPEAARPAAEKAPEVEAKTAEEADKEKEETLKNSPEMAEIKKEIDAMPREEKMGFARGIKSIGLHAMKGKSELFANGLEKAYGKTKSDNIFTRSIKGLAKTYRGEAEKATKQLDDARKGKTHGVVSSAYLGGGAIKYGRVALDIIGTTAFMPLRYAMLGGLGFARLAEGVKEGQFENEALLDKTRIETTKDAAEEAWKIYEEAKAANGDQPVDSAALQEAYNKNIPASLMERLNKNTLTAKVGMASHIIQEVAKWNISHSAVKIQRRLDNIENDKDMSKTEKSAAQKKMLASYERRLNDWDRAVTQYGKADALAMGARYAELAGKTAVAALGAETIIYGTFHTLAELFGKSDLSHAAEAAATAHGARGGFTAPDHTAVAQGHVGASLPNQAPETNVHPNIGPINAGAPHEFTTAQADALHQPAPTHFGPMPHEAAPEIPRGESVPVPEAFVHADYTATIPEHGSAWEAAKSIGLNQKELSDAWTNPHSIIHTPEGPVQISKLNLVHPGDIVKFMPGNGGHPGHFEVFPGSGKPMGTMADLDRLKEAAKAVPHPPFAEHPTAPGQEAWVKEVFGKPSTGHDNTMGYPDHYPPQIPTHPDHPPGNPIWENAPTHAAGHTPIVPEHPGLPHEVTGSVEAHPGSLADTMVVRGYSGAEYMAKDYRNDVLSYALAHHLDMQNEITKFQNISQSLTGRIKLYEQIHADPAKLKEASALLQAIKESMGQIAKTYGNDVIDKAKLPDFLK